MEIGVHLAASLRARFGGVAPVHVGEIGDRHRLFAPVESLENFQLLGRQSTSKAIFYRYQRLYTDITRAHATIVSTAASPSVKARESPAACPLRSVDPSLWTKTNLKCLDQNVGAVREAAECLLSGWPTAGAGVSRANRPTEQCRRVAKGSAKPESALSFELRTVAAKVIAHWTAILAAGTRDRGSLRRGLDHHPTRAGVRLSNAQ